MVNLVQLLPLNHNKYGTLYSFDLPNKKGNTLEDGSQKHTYEKGVGWLVSDYLKNSWKLYLGDSLELMASNKLPYNIDIFFNDSFTLIIIQWEKLKSQFRKQEVMH